MKENDVTIETKPEIHSYDRGTIEYLTASGVNPTLIERVRVMANEIAYKKRALAEAEVKIAALETAAPAPQPVVLGELSDALLIVDGYDVMEGDVVPERELWPVINAARKVLEGAAPQPMDRESLEKAIEQAASDVDLAKYFLPGTTDCFVDAVLALLNGTAK